MRQLHGYFFNVFWKKKLGHGEKTDNLQLGKIRLLQGKETYCIYPIIKYERNWLSRRILLVIRLNMQILVIKLIIIC